MLDVPTGYNAMVDFQSVGLSKSSDDACSECSARRFEEIRLDPRWSDQGIRSAQLFKESRLALCGSMRELGILLTRTALSTLQVFGGGLAPERA